MWRELRIRVIVREQHYQKAFELLNRTLETLYRRYGVCAHIEVLNHNRRPVIRPPSL